VTDDVFVYPGGFHFGPAGTRISTLLGSCVAVCLWHPGLRIGGMCHFMLPGRGRTASAPGDGRFAEGAFELFLAELARTGTRPSQYNGKIFGGGVQMLEGRVAGANVAAGLALLDRHGFPLLTRDVGGTGARFLHFDLATGDVWVRRTERWPTDVAS
jgi:chemotaxis protein CheD